MFVMVKMDTSLLKDISDDMDFCIKLAREEKFIILPGIVLCLKNWLRITFSIDLPCRGLNRFVRGMPSH
ncbi:hypothetical protein MKX03_002441, partial [Papaver bracteatum]